MNVKEQPQMNTWTPAGTTWLDATRVFHVTDITGLIPNEYPRYACQAGIEAGDSSNFANTNRVPYFWEPYSADHPELRCVSLEPKFNNTGNHCHVSAHYVNVWPVVNVRGGARSVQFQTDRDIDPNTGNFRDQIFVSDASGHIRRSDPINVEASVNSVVVSVIRPGTEVFGTAQNNPCSHFVGKMGNPQIGDGNTIHAPDHAAYYNKALNVAKMTFGLNWVRPGCVRCDRIDYDRNGLGFLAWRISYEFTIFELGVGFNPEVRYSDPTLRTVGIVLPPVLTNLFTTYNYADTINPYVRVGGLVGGRKVVNTHRYRELNYLLQAFNYPTS